MFCPDEYVYIDDNGVIRTEEGYRYPIEELARQEDYSFLRDGWSIWEDLRNNWSDRKERESKMNIMGHTGYMNKMNEMMKEMEKEVAKSSARNKSRRSRCGGAHIYASKPEHVKCNGCGFKVLRVDDNGNCKDCE